MTTKDDIIKKRKRCLVCNKKLNRYNVNSYCRKHLAHGKSIEKAQKGMIKIEDVKNMIDEKITDAIMKFNYSNVDYSCCEIKIYLDTELRKELKQSLQELGEKE
jgi:hypothetical protein